MTAAPAPDPNYARLHVGDPVPWFSQDSTIRPKHGLDTAAGRYILLCFFGSAAESNGKMALQAAWSQRTRFDDDRMAFFGVSIDPTDKAEHRVHADTPGLRCFWDFDCTASRLFGSAPHGATSGLGVPLRLFWMVLDPTLRVMATFPLSQPTALFAFLDALPPPERHVGFEVAAPVLVIPNVFEPDLCRHLIGLYEANGGEESGIMTEIDGKTVGVMNKSFKVRRDHALQDRSVIDQVQRRIVRRVVPEIRKVHQTEVTRAERYVVCCYSSEEGAHFKPHRDNTTAGTAHRRFAVSINLNAEFEGGEVSFPEYGPRRFKAPVGGAVVFSCSLLHAVSLVTSGRRYAFLPFLYDEAGERTRKATADLIVPMARPGVTRTGLERAGEPTFAV